MFDLVGKTLQEATSLLQGQGIAYTVETDDTNEEADQLRVVRMDSAYHLVCMGFLSAPKEEDHE